MVRNLATEMISLCSREGQLPMGMLEREKKHFILDWLRSREEEDTAMDMWRDMHGYKEKLAA
jgi:hypothetical protein